MKLIQLNMWWGGKLSNSIMDLFQEISPDIVCLQESVGFNKSDAGLFLSTQQLQKEFDLAYAASAPAFSFKLMEGIATFGNCILSRMPIETSETIYTNLDHIEDFDFNEHDYNVRNLLHCSIKNGGQLLHVLTHHGHHLPAHKEGDEDTYRQMRQIAEYVATLDGPVILTGDFNLSPHSKSLELINKILTNLSIAHKLKTTRTRLTNKNEVCDYIFINDGVRVSKFYTSDQAVSDHAALILDFDV